MNRRTFLQTTFAASLASLVQAASPRVPRLILRSSWQVVNIGDIAHTPGVLALLEKHIPQATITLWASGDLNEEVAAMEQRRFPKLKIVKGSLKEDGSATTRELGEAIQEANFLLHGSGPSLVAAKDVEAFAKHTHKPYGIYGITYGGGTETQRKTITGAKFAYFRDSVSLEKAKSDGIRSPIMEFGPDGAFACDLRNEPLAQQYLKDQGLEEGKFLCCLTRLRYTPYWLVRKGQTVDKAKQARNDEMREHDHAPIREAICAVVRKTGYKVLVCPEDKTQMQVTRDNIIDKLPKDVLPKVVWREKYWLTDEALSVYVRSAGVFGMEMHSPIMAIGNGIPAIVGRFKEQTSKGFMWRDIGLGDWLFDMDKPDKVANYTAAVLSLIEQPAKAREKVKKAQEVVQKRQRETMQVVRQHLLA
jgi:hypothetical protein